jgi:large subunit ribosomal protein L21
MKQEIAPASYAIFKTGGKQYQAVVGKTVAIEKIDAKEGESVKFDAVLLRKMVDDAGKESVEIGQPFLKTPVQASILKHERGPKIIIFHFKRRKKYKRKSGHRQPFTVVRIESI